MVTGSPWDPWTPIWRALLHLVGNPTNYTLWVYGELSMTTTCLILSTPILCLSVAGTVLVTSVHYWLSAAAYMWLDLTGTPAFLTKYKIQPGKNAPLPPGRLFAVIRTVLLNQLAGAFLGCRDYLLSAAPPEAQTSRQTFLNYIWFVLPRHPCWYDELGPLQQTVGGGAAGGPGGGVARPANCPDPHPSLHSLPRCLVLLRPPPPAPPSHIQTHSQGQYQ